MGQRRGRYMGDQLSQQVGRQMSRSWLRPCLFRHRDTAR